MPTRFRTRFTRTVAVLSLIMYVVAMAVLHSTSQSLAVRSSSSADRDLAWSSADFLRRHVQPHANPEKGSYNTAVLAII
ncbi:hypothetical protein [Corynebacterium cystitidis]|uniref:hypothetical protein n=1 Tax=Corynebacterium cystitidis TaxID=35757 RepID=UPI00115FCD6D|nr:hypothetical protein [Corynebacterium cystitidis]